jgi:hypothetical protein
MTPYTVLVLTGLHYHPKATTLDAGYNKHYFEFIELQNIGPNSVDLGFVLCLPRALPCSPTSLPSLSIQVNILYLLATSMHFDNAMVTLLRLQGPMLDQISATAANKLLRNMQELRFSTLPTMMLRRGHLNQMVMDLHLKSSIHLETPNDATNWRASTTDGGTPGK